MQKLNCVGEPEEQGKNKATRVMIPGGEKSKKRVKNPGSQSAFNPQSYFYTRTIARVS